MSAGLDLIRTIGPEFVDVADADVEVFLEMAAQQSSASAWGAVFLQAMCFLAMHEMSQFGHGTANPHAGTGSVAGGIASVKVGDVSVGFGANAAASKAGEKVIFEIKE